MTRGRKAQPAAIREAKGNPGHRRIVEVEEPDQAKGGAAFPFKVSTAAKLVEQMVGSQLRAINMLRPSDEAAFWRYCQNMAEYWKITEKLNRVGLTQKVKTVAGGFMQRLRPEFTAQDRIGRRLDLAEDRFGLTPASRQQILMMLMRSTQSQLPLPLPAATPPAEQQGNEPPANLPKVVAPPVIKPPLIGGPNGVH